MVSLSFPTQRRVILLISSPVCLYAGVAELADALDLGSSVFGRRGSSPLSRTVCEVPGHRSLDVPGFFVCGAADVSGHRSPL